MLSSHTHRVRLLEVMGNAIVGGMETSVLRLIERLTRERFEISVLAPFESRCTEALHALGVDVVIVPMPEDTVWSSVQQASALVRAGRIDVLHAHLGNAHILAGLTGRLTDRPVLATVHGRQMDPLELEAHRAFGTHVHAVCRHSHLHALGMGIAPSHLHCIPNGVDTELFRPQPNMPSESLRTGLGIGEGVPLAGFVGRLSPEKGPELFVRCAQRVLDRQPQAHFVMIGDGPQRASVEDRIERLGLRGRVHLAGMQAAMPTLYPQLDLLVCSSLSEAMPLAVMEAMACGLPVVATAVGGVPELVVEDLTGSLVGHGDVDGLAYEVAALLADPARRREMGRQGRQRIEQRFALARSVSGIAALLQRLARREGASAEVRVPASAAKAADKVMQPVRVGRARGDGNGKAAGVAADAGGSAAVASAVVAQPPAGDRR
ncbi:MAG TPA: glycosyltransferase [Burkholderiaceae bacterium]|nr:glycosyltransferase [Burkholderiaceae bacterium]